MFASSPSFKSQLLSILVGSLALTACASEPTTLWHSPDATPSSIAAEKAAVEQPAKPIGVVPIFVATSRKPQNNPAQPFSAQRSSTLHYLRVDIGIPKEHKKGFVEANSFKPDTAKHFAATALQNYKDREDFKRQINAALAKKPKGKRDILLFIHGYNNNFADSTFRAAQFAYDFKLDAVTVHYAWPSGGKIGLYVFDRDSADFARDGLADLIKLLNETNADQFNIVAHSMGNYVMMEALRTLALKGDSRAIQDIDGLLMAAPDIDLDVFERQLKDIKKMPQPTAVFASHKDAALAISGTLTGGHARVGDGSSIDILNKNGIAVVDMSNVDGGSHDVFASSPTLMAMVRDGSISDSVLAGDGMNAGEAILADGTSVFRGATSLILYTPGRIIQSVAE